MNKYAKDHARFTLFVFLVTVSVLCTFLAIGAIWSVGLHYDNPENQEITIPVTLEVWEDE